MHRPCADRISREDYKKDIERLKRFMASKKSVVLREMGAEMKAASAAHISRRRRGCAIGSRRFKSWRYPAMWMSMCSRRCFMSIRPGLERLAKVLDMEHVPRIIEGIDIANLQGDESVGALVCFIDGVPFKSGYKRFGIKTVEGQDDYAMIMMTSCKVDSLGRRGESSPCTTLDHGIVVLPLDSLDAESLVPAFDGTPSIKHTRRRRIRRLADWRCRCLR